MIAEAAVLGKVTSLERTLCLFELRPLRIANVYGLVRVAVFSRAKFQR